MIFTYVYRGLLNAYRGNIVRNFVNNEPEEQLTYKSISDWTVWGIANSLKRFSNAFPFVFIYINTYTHTYVCVCYISRLESQPARSEIWSDLCVRVLRCDNRCDLFTFTLKQVAGSKCRPTGHTHIYTHVCKRGTIWEVGGICIWYTYR